MANSNFNYVSSGGSEWTLISSGDQAANGDLIFTSLDSTKDYMLLVCNSYATQADAFGFNHYTSQDNGSTYDSTYYNGRADFAAAAYQTVGTTSQATGTYNPVTAVTSRSVISGLASGSYTRCRTKQVGTTGASIDCHSYVNHTNAVNAIKFTFSGIGGSGRTAYKWFSRSAV